MSMLPPSPPPGCMYLEGYLYGDRPTDAGRRAGHRRRPGGRDARGAVAVGSRPGSSCTAPSSTSLLDRVDLLFANEQEACGIVG